MESSNGSTPKMTQITDIQMGHENMVTTRSDHVFQTTSALEILRETIRILRYNLSGFMAIGAFLICPVSAVLLSNVLVDQGLVKRVVIRLLLVAKSCGLPLSSFVERFCFKFAESAVAAVMCFPLYVTLLLISKAAVVYSVDCTYSRKMFDASKCYVIVRKIWKRILATYLLACSVVIGSLTLFLGLLAGVSSLFSVIGFTPDLNAYMVIIFGLFFSVFFANAVIICDLSMVISVLEDVSGAEALLRSSVLIRGQTQVGLMIFLGSTIGMAFIEGLFEHRVKTLSYGDGSSRIWEGPLLVVMYSFVVLINFMMSTVFYFSCKSYSLENDSSIECQSVLEALTVSPVPEAQ
ncbi:hypothetical protein CTI12_AA438800 [Artemisia annua]|uniref:Son of sevenless n=1 Tax=Artemisia annua TaxID=35608 RepID=A0A2U1LYP8_ARTAN|nr:hypothetical protein CTI12_AA438800 [Artemisia annua]